MPVCNILLILNLGWFIIVKMLSWRGAGFVRSTHEKALVFKQKQTLAYTHAKRRKNRWWLTHQHKQIKSKRIQRELETKPDEGASCVCALELCSAFSTELDYRDCFELQKGQPERLNNLQENCIYSGRNLHRTQLGLWINPHLPVVPVCR